MVETRRRESDDKESEVMAESSQCEPISWENNTK